MYHNLTEIYISKKEFEKAKESALKSLEISTKYKKVEGMGISNLLLGEINMHIDTAAVLKNYYKALDIADSFKIVKLQTALYLDLADYFRMKNKLEKAKHYLNLALKKSKETNKLFYIQKSYKGLADIFADERNYKKAFENYKLYNVYKDSINAEKVRLQIAGLENDKKENKIRLLNKENKIIELKARRTKVLAYFSVLFIVLILMIFYFLFQNYKHKQNIKKVQLLHQSEQKLLEMEKRILSSVIETENRERKRFAMDLHDGLGPLLSGIRLYVGEMDYLSGKDKKTVIVEIKKLIDQAISDIRSISRNIMPDSFSENGLVKSLELFINKIKPISNIKIDFVNHLGNKKFNKGFEIIIYRIITELINNSIKHSGADLIRIEFLTIQNKFIIYYKDNGKGFDVENVIKGSKGLGLKNIRDRINTLGGFMNINSTIGQGVDIEIQIDY
ncbi:MAG TPA: sensor histidine kinase [Bacteroidetes bacterium]|nr:sensor histidine kinase [Bacteroidota bacterium]